MSSRLDELNKLVSEHVGEYKIADEKLFELGVELGRELQKLEIAEYRLPFFQNQAQLVDAKTEKRKYVKQLNSAIENLVLMAVKAHVAQYGSLHFNASYRRKDYEKLDDDIGERFGIRYTRITQPTLGDDFEIHFTFVGKLANYFKDNDVTPEFSIVLFNTHGDNREHIDERIDDCNRFGAVSCSLTASNPSQSVEFIKDFCDGFEKQILMYYLSVK